MSDTSPAPSERLENGELPARPEAVLALLDQLGIVHRTWEHPPVMTVIEAKAERGELEGAHIKNLFLRNKKGRMWLVTCLEDRQIDLKAMGQTLGGGRLSFASPDRLMRYLGVLPGSVTPLAALNDRNQVVTVVIDKAIEAHEIINVHPLVNHMTTALTPSALYHFLDYVKHSPTMIDLADYDRGLS